MISCKKCGYKMPQYMATPLKCSCGEPLGTGMFVMVDAKEFEGIQDVLGKVDILVNDPTTISLADVQTRITKLKESFNLMRNLPKTKT